MTKDELRETLGDLERRERRIERLRAPLTRFTRWLHKPFNNKLDAINEEREQLLAEHSSEIIGRCLTCDAVIFEGEPYTNCGDGMKLCAEHAPTWDDVATHYRDILAKGEPIYGDFDADDIKQWLADAERLIAAGRGNETTASP